MCTWYEQYDYITFRIHFNMWSDDIIQFKMKFIEGDFFTTQNDDNYDDNNDYG